MKYLHIAFLLLFFSVSYTYAANDLNYGFETNSLYTAPNTGFSMRAGTAAVQTTTIIHGGYSVRVDNSSWIFTDINNSSDGEFGHEYFAWIRPQSNAGGAVVNAEFTVGQELAFRGNDYLRVNFYGDGRVHFKIIEGGAETSDTDAGAYDANTSYFVVVRPNWITGKVSMYYYNVTGATLVGSAVNKDFSENLSVKRIHLTADTQFWADDITYRGSYVKVNYPSGNGKIFSASPLDVNFSVVGIPAALVKLYRSSAQLGFDTNISIDINLAAALPSTMSCDGNLFTRLDCTYDWNFINPWTPLDINYYIDINAYSGTKYQRTDSSDYNFSLLGIDINRSYPSGAFASTHKTIYSINGICATYDVNTFVDAVLIDNRTATKNVEYTITYTPTTASPFDLNIVAGCYYAGNQLREDSNVTYTIDITPPVIVSYGFDVNSGFFNSAADLNAEMKCTDNNSATIVYKLENTTTTIISGTYASGVTAEQPVTSITDRTLTATCTDVSGNQTTATKTADAYLQYYYLVDEYTGQDFNLGEVTDAIFYNLDRNLSWDLKAKSDLNVYAIANADDLLRLELTYDNAGTDLKITRDFSMAVMEDTNVPICAWKLEQPYKLVFTSGIERKIVVQSIFTGCYVLGSYTNIAYQQSLMNYANTINKLYSFWTYDTDGVKYSLGSLDGTNNTTVNLDMVVFNKTQYNINISGEEAQISMVDANTAQIYYYNSARNNASVNMKIYDGSTILLNQNFDTNNNEIYTTFNWTTLTLNEELLKLVITMTRTDGTTSEITRWFNQKAGGIAGALRPEVAAIFAILTFIFGITFVSVKFSMGWFGLIITFISVAILSLASTTWYITYLQAIMIICGLFIAIVMRDENLGAA